MNNANPWYLVDKDNELCSPALLLYPDRIRDNIELMIEIAGGPQRLRPHVKTHKNAEIIKLQQQKGIERFKCATIVEAKLLAQCGAEDILWAMQPTGPNMDLFFGLMDEFPKSRFSTLVDNAGSIELLSRMARHKKQKISLWLDLNTGMNRTGIVPGPKAVDLFKAMHAEPWIETRGLHAYDGHIHEPDLKSRKEKCQESIGPVLEMKAELLDLGIKVRGIIAGGSPTFGIHAKNKDLELSPGTTLLWDAGYGSKYPELGFKIAASLFTRVVSIPNKDLICTDLGHKSVASEMPLPRVIFPGHPQLRQVGQSEEHLILENKGELPIEVGQGLYAIPMHICPTVSKYSKAHIVEENTVVATWKIRARDHELEDIS